MNFDQASAAEHELALHNAGHPLPFPIEDPHEYGHLDSAIREIAWEASQGDPEAMIALDAIFTKVRRRRGDDTPDVTDTPDDRQHDHHYDDPCYGITHDGFHCPDTPTHVLTVQHLTGQSTETVAVCDTHHDAYGAATETVVTSCTPIPDREPATYGGDTAA